ncbi:16S rRNA (guanine(527)-N(7))-methyltransferase RsmG [Clostridium cellulovorans]|uniref:Ribosomal RNA small subunit methyltransferase G n=1 Tax=Clostridium cellulovorans (strain ATCC 35296 / DSM 3052 / OCM 3 / 743B) TaxID=573061 RepID=D9SPD3_CLOC7|nr:16S rRNA (guanine(527)-N(7))-methyltransferase RsmG [Clostridium cellulovorans]ADL54035.1 methyltransferase GidB [Clostridium cellulovorans 743B]
MEFYEIMKKSAENEGLMFDEIKYNQFIKYKNLLKEWNEKINLTAITEDEEIIKKHFIDSIKIFRFSPLSKMNNIIDVGTGAGFPGLPIKIVNPDIKVTLLDSLNKRVNFLNTVISELGINNIDAIHGRAEEFSRKEEHRGQFDGAVSRAVANLTVLSELCIPYVKNNGYFIALKGPAVEEEIKQAKKAIGILGGKLEEILPVEVEGTDLRHNLVIIKKVKDTPKIYPRNAGNITKKPLI